MSAPLQTFSQDISQLSTQPAAPSTGQGAVEKAAGQGGMADAESAAPPSAEAAQTVRIVGSKVFVSTEGLWMDTAFDPEKMKTVIRQPVRKEKRPARRRVR